MRNIVRASFWVLARYFQQCVIRYECMQGVYFCNIYIRVGKGNQDGSGEPENPRACAWVAHAGSKELYRRETKTTTMLSLENYFKDLITVVSLFCYASREKKSEERNLGKVGMRRSLHGADFWRGFSQTSCFAMFNWLDIFNENQLRCSSKTFLPYVLC